MSKTALAILFSQLAPSNSVDELMAGVRIVVIPDGEFAAGDGRPGTLTKGKVTKWRMNAANAKSVLDAIGARQKQELVLDYEHQTINAASNGKPAPAAAWMSDFKYEVGRGITALVKYVKDAAEQIAQGAYKYISPAFIFDMQTGDVQRLLHAGLTNDPALDNVTATALSRWRGDDLNNLQSQKEDTTMSLAVALRAIVGAKEDATETQLLEAVAALKKQADAPDAAKFVAVAVLKAEQDQVTALRQEVATLKGEKAQGEIKSAIASAKKEGAAITDAFQAHLLKVAETDAALCAQMIKDLPRVPGLDGKQQSTQANAGNTPDGSGTTGTAALTQSQKDMASAMGLSHEALAKQIAKQREAGLQI